MQDAQVAKSLEVPDKSLSPRVKFPYQSLRLNFFICGVCTGFSSECLKEHSQLTGFNQYTQNG